MIDKQIYNLICDKIYQETSGLTELLKKTEGFEQERVLDKLFDYLEHMLKEYKDKYEMPIFLEIAYLLSREINPPKVWKRIKNVALEANDIRKNTMRIAFLEQIPEEPIRTPDLKNLWQLWFCKETRWVVYISYWNKKDLLNIHFVKYVPANQRKLSINKLNMTEYYRIRQISEMIVD
jgi:hypothetical protein